MLSKFVTLIYLVSSISIAPAAPYTFELNVAIVVGLLAGQVTILSRVDSKLPIDNELV